MSVGQKRRLEAEAARRGTSVGSLIREAVDARFGAVAPGDRRHALEGIRALAGKFLTPDELNRISAEERDQQIGSGSRRPFPG